MHSFKQSNNLLKKESLLIFLFHMILFQSMAQISYPVIFQDTAYDFPYHLTKPEKSIKLSSKLDEISGIAHIKDDLFACIHDEKGNLYIIDFEKNEIERKIKFNDPADYEDIALVGKNAWVLKSNGNMYVILDYLNQGKEAESIKVESKLRKKNDCEGLAYNPVNNELLIACKGHPYIEKKKSKNRKAIYSYNLEEHKLKSKPKYLINLKEIKENRVYNSMAKWGIELMSFLDDNKGDVSFQPSGIAVHPFTQNIYVLAHVGDLLVVLNQQGGILALVDLKDSLFGQPEGICFDDNGQLYISNEAGNNKASIHKFNMIGGKNE